MGTTTLSSLGKKHKPNKSKPQYSFKNKRITLMGLGLLGRGVNVAKYLASKGAKLTITDLKDKTALKHSIHQLKNHKSQINYRLGKHNKEDFENKDLILMAAGVPTESQFIKHAESQNIPIKMDASLFCQLVPEGVTIIGVTGTRGKSTVSHLIHHILISAGYNSYLAGNIRGIATLPLLDKVKPGDYVVLELDSWQLQGFGRSKISPNISVFTNLMPDHMNYYKNDMDRYLADKANIFINQTQKDNFITTQPTQKTLDTKNYIPSIKSKISLINQKGLVSIKKAKLIGKHNQINASLAQKATQILGINDSLIQTAINNFQPVEGRLQKISSTKYNIYNDNNATTPQATLAAIESLANNKNIILLCGGTDKQLDLGKLPDAINKSCRAIGFIPGNGSDKLASLVDPFIPSIISSDLKTLLNFAIENYESADNVILFSPGFASFSEKYANEYQRNDDFMKTLLDLRQK